MFIQELHLRRCLVAEIITINYLIIAIIGLQPPMKMDGCLDLIFKALLMARKTIIKDSQKNCILYYHNLPSAIISIQPKSPPTHTHNTHLIPFNILNSFPLPLSSLFFNNSLFIHQMTQQILTLSSNSIKLIEQVCKYKHDTCITNITVAVAVQNTIVSTLPFLFRSIPQPMHTK